MVEAIVCAALMAGLTGIWIFAMIAKKYFARQRRAGIYGDTFLARVFSETPPRATSRAVPENASAVAAEIETATMR